MGKKIDRRTTDTKERIIQEVLHLYKQGGIAAVKLNDITKALRVTRAALYNHFPEGKDQIFLEALASMTHELETMIANIIDSVPDTRQRLKELLLLGTHTSIDLDIFFLEQEELSQAVKNRMAELIRPLIEQMSCILQEGMARGDLRTIELSLATLSFGMLVKHIDQLVNKQARLLLEMCLHPQQEKDILIDQLLDLWLTGMANQEHRDLPTGTDLSCPNRPVESSNFS